MPLRRTRRTTVPRTTRTTRTAPRPSLKTRLLGPRRTAGTTRRAPATTTTTTTTTRTTKHHGGTTGMHHGGPTTVHHRRHATMGDKVSGALMRLRGSLTRRPGLKAAGARRMHGTDGRTTRRHHL